MSYSYIFQGKILTYSTDLSKSTNVSNSLEEQYNKHVLLNENQIVFYAANPTASIEEVWNCQLRQYEELTNADIKLIRQEQYKLRSDSLYMAYQKYLALDQTEKAEANRLSWLAEIELIDSENPYTIITNE